MLTKCMKCETVDCKNCGVFTIMAYDKEKGWHYRPVKEDNMWNYESLPERQENGVSDHVIVAVEGCPYGQSGYYDFDLQAWFVDGCSEPVKVEAWQKVELPKIEKAEKYRPFRDTDELIKVWEEKTKPYRADTRIPPIINHLIWVRRKESNCKGQLITKFSDPSWVIMSTEAYNMTDLLVHFTFLDGSPCGVKE